MARKNTWIWVVAILAVAFFLYNRSMSREAVVGITTPSSRILYINEPVDFNVVLEHGNATAVSGNGTVIDTDNSTAEIVEVEPIDFDVKIDSQPVNHTVTELTENREFSVYVENPSEGYLTVSVKDVILTMELRKPLIHLEHDVPIQAYVGEKYTFTVNTLTPQGGLLDVEKVILEITDPTNEVTVLDMTEESEGTFTYEMEYEDDHNYYFDITPVAPNWNTKKVEATTVVLGEAPMPVLTYFLIVSAVIFVVLVIIKNRKKIARLF